MTYNSAYQPSKPHDFSPDLARPYDLSNLGQAHGALFGFICVALTVCHLYTLSFCVGYCLREVRGFRGGVLFGLLNVFVLWAAPWWLPEQSYSCEAGHCRLDSHWLHELPIEASQRFSSGSFVIKKAEIQWVGLWEYGFPRVLILDKSPVESRKTEKKVLPNTPHRHNISTLSTDLFHTLYLGKASAKSPWRDLIGSLGLRHLLCFSGWHAYKLWRTLGGRRGAFAVIGGIYLGILGVPFAFLVAYLKGLGTRSLPREYEGHIWPCVLLIGLVVRPFCWLHLGIWLSLYYIILIELTGFEENRFRVGSLGWSALMGDPLEVIPWCLGAVLEKLYWPFFVGVGLLYGLALLFAPFGSLMDGGAYPILSFLSVLRERSPLFTIPPALGLVLVAAPLLTRSSQVFELTKSVFFRSRAQEGLYARQS